MHNINMLSGNDLKQLRRQKGFTQQELAKKAGLSQSLIARIEKGTVDPRLSTIKKISNVLEKTKKVIYAEDVMSKPLIYVSSDETVSQTISKMEKYSISQLPVIENGKQIGSIKDSSLIKEMKKHKLANFSRMHISEIMEKSFPTVAKDTLLDDIYSLLQKNPAVLVVDKISIIGIITRADILGLIR